MASHTLCAERVPRFSDGYGRDSGRERHAGALAEAVFGNFPADWTSAAKQTHLSGIVARLTEMGVISRTWSGRRVAYGIAKVDRCPLYDHIAKITG